MHENLHCTLIKTNLSCIFYLTGLFYFLGSIVNFSQEQDVHFKYIQVKSIYTQFMVQVKFLIILQFFDHPLLVFFIAGCLQDWPG